MSNASTTKWKPSDAQREILEALIELEKQHESASDFVRRCLPYHGSKWTKIKHALDANKPASYFDEIKNPDELMEELESLLNNLRSKGTRARGPEIRKTSHLLALRQAVREAYDCENEERLIVYLAPTRGGKSIGCRFLEREVSARILEARQEWRGVGSRYKGGGYRVFLRDMAAALGVRLDGETGCDAMADLVVKFLSDKKIVLGIDEAEYFGKEIIDGIKHLLNKSRVVIVVYAIPEAYDSWNRWFRYEASQLAGRTRCIIEAMTVSPADTKLFFPSEQFSEPAKALELISTKATEFGAYSLVQRVATRLKDSPKAELDEVKEAVGKALAEMKRIAVKKG